MQHDDNKAFQAQSKLLYYIIALESRVDNHEQPKAQHVLTERAKLSCSPCECVVLRKSSNRFINNQKGSSERTIARLQMPFKAIETVEAVAVLLTGCQKAY